MAHPRAKNRFLDWAMPKKYLALEKQSSPDSGEGMTITVMS